jgi:hypothetical protein
MEGFGVRTLWLMCQGNCMNTTNSDENLHRASYGAREHVWDAVPGLRFAPPWATFVSSLREDRGDGARAEPEENLLSTTTIVHAIALTIN